ncbi:MAG: hypothetical protein QOG99_3899 [Frankiales bacterium]|jgi:hypothetical protein|nr:hypothetical protein [Frankiales bacterium]
MTRPDESLAPSRRSRRTGAAPTGAHDAGADSDYDDAEIARGSTTALLGALGRMQLKLDLLARENSETLARLEAKVDALQQTIDELTVVEE